MSAPRAGPTRVTSPWPPGSSGIGGLRHFTYEETGDERSQCCEVRAFSLPLLCLPGWTAVILPQTHSCDTAVSPLRVVIALKLTGAENIPCADAEFILSWW